MRISRARPVLYEIRAHLDTYERMTKIKRIKIRRNTVLFLLQFKVDGGGSHITPKWTVFNCCMDRGQSLDCQYTYSSLTA